MKLTERVNTALAWTPAACASVWPFLFVRLHVNLNDEFYQALGIRSLDTSALSPLTSVLGGAWCALFGETIISLRCCAIVALLLSIGIGVGYMYRRGYTALQCALAYSVLTMSLTLGQYYAYGHNIFGWDAISYPFLVITTVGLLMWADSRQSRWLVISAVSCGLLGAARLPSAVALVVIAIVAVCVKGTMRQRFINLALVLALCMGTFIAVMGCIYGSFDGWIAAIESSVITGHSVSSILTDSLGVLPPVMLYWLPGLGALVVLRLRQCRRGIVSGIVAVCLIYLICYHFATLATGYMQMPCIVLLAGAFFITPKERASGGLFAAVAAMFFCMAFGSDVFPDRVYAPVLGAVVLGLYSPDAMRGFMGRFVFVIAVGTVMISAAFGLRYIHSMGECVAYERGHSGLILMPQHEYDIMEGITQPDAQGNVARAGGLKYPGDFILTDDAGYCRTVFHYEDMAEDEMAAEVVRLGNYERIELLPGSGKFAWYALEKLSDDYFVERGNDISVVLAKRTTGRR